MFLFRVLLGFSAEKQPPNDKFFRDIKERDRVFLLHSMARTPYFFKVVFVFLGI